MQTSEGTRPGSDGGDEMVDADRPNSAAAAADEEETCTAAKQHERTMTRPPVVDSPVTVTVMLAPYSEHSNYEELQAFVGFVRPAHIVPTVYADDRASKRIVKRFAGLLDSTAAKRDFLALFSGAEGHRGAQKSVGETGRVKNNAFVRAPASGSSSAGKRRRLTRDPGPATPAAVRAEHGHDSAAVVGVDGSGGGDSGGGGDGGGADGGGGDSGGGGDGGGGGVRSLCEMGFAHDVAVRALRLADGDVERAVGSLLYRARVGTG
jgi:hypothetical protein